MGVRRGGSIFMKATPNLLALEKIELQDSNVSIANIIYVPRCLFADKSASLFSQRFSSYSEEITIYHVPPAMLR